MYNRTEIGFVMMIMRIYSFSEPREIKDTYTTPSLSQLTNLPAYHAHADGKKICLTPVPTLPNWCNTLIRPPFSPIQNTAQHSTASTTVIPLCPPDKLKADLAPQLLTTHPNQAHNRDRAAGRPAKSAILLPDQRKRREISHYKHVLPSLGFLTHLVQNRKESSTRQG
jgi:hypothetical protein